ncbi:histidine phosphatase family protein [Luteococcus sediminum]
MTTTQIILVRHGQSEGNVAAELAASQHLERIDAPARDADVELSELGRRQAAAVGQWLHELDESERPTRVWTSPFRRARQTARIAVEGSGLKDSADADLLDPRIDERLRDRDMGITDMLTADGIRKKYPEEAERRAWLGKFYYRPPGGESWADVAGRVRAVMGDIAAQNEGECVLVSAHDVVNLLFCYVAEGMDEHQVLERSQTNGLRNAAICRLVREEDSRTGWTVTDYNIDSHLREAGITVTDQPGASDEVGAPAAAGTDGTDRLHGEREADGDE